MTEPMTTSIDKIREQVARVRREHRSAIANGCDGLPVDGICSTCDDTTWPCPVLRLAERVLKLSEWIEKRDCECTGELLGGVFFSHSTECSRKEIERILAEVAE